MDIFPFVYSRDIREYLEKTEYRFNSLEAAWLIYQNRNLCYEEKKEAWMELIQTMPDCPVPKRPNCAGWDSLHAMLREYTGVTDQIIAEFYEEHLQDVYRYSYLYEGDGSWTEEYETVYGSLGACVGALKQELAEADEYRDGEGTGVVLYRIRKQTLGNTGYMIELEYNEKDQILHIGRKVPLSEKESRIMDESFQGLWFQFPTPFQKGDLVWDPAMQSGKRMIEGGPFVLTHLSTWNPLEIVVSQGDNTDMMGEGYFSNEDGTVYGEVMSNYMDLEYYRGPYKEHKKILELIGKYLKGETDLEMLLHEYHRMWLKLETGRSDS